MCFLSKLFVKILHSAIDFSNFWMYYIYEIHIGEVGVAMLEKFGMKISNIVAANIDGIDDTQKEIISYTVIQLIGEFTKIAIMIIIAHLLNITGYFLLSIFGTGFYRVPSGGVHTKSHIQCFLLTSLLFFANVFLSIITKDLYLDPLYIGIFIFNIIVITLFAPADTEMKPIINKKQRKSLKIISYIMMTLLILTGRFITTDYIIRNILIYGTAIQSITMLPFMYKIIGTKYGYRDGITEPQI